LEDEMSKEKRRPAPKTVNVKDAVFAYFSKCCNVIAEKPACAVPKGHIVGTYPGFVPQDAEGTLGSWRCPTCRKPCKVTRSAKQEAANV
jgi:hypothetical protein